MIEIAIAAALAAAQTIEVEPGTPPEVATAFEAWANCLIDRVEGDDGRLPPQRAADAALAGCGALQTALTGAHARWLETAPLDARAKRNMRRSMARSVAQLRGQVARLIRSVRED